MNWSDIAQWVAAIAAVAGVMWAHLSLRATTRTLTASITESRYSQLDSMYFELLRLRIENPLLAGERPEGPVEQTAWDNYACCVWNFVETVLDYCDESGPIQRAWAPAVAHERAIYSAWLTPVNLRRYHPGFVERVDELVDRIAAGPTPESLPANTIEAAQVVAEIKL